MNVLFKSRDFLTLLNLSGFDFQPSRYSFAAVGGPEQATIAARIVGSHRTLPAQSLFELARCAVEIYSDEGTLCWWGYVEKVVTGESLKSTRLQVDLAEMYNSVKVIYTLIKAGTTSVGIRYVTAAGTDSASIAEYGTKELLLSLPDASALRATAARDNALAALRYPIAGRAQVLEVEDAALLNSSDAVLICKGWWNTLGWRYYENALSAYTTTAAQIQAMLAGCDFIAGVDFAPGLSGETGNQYRRGEATVRTEVEALLNAGIGGVRLLASVYSNRRVYVYPQPTTSTAYHISGDILRTEYYNRVMPWEAPAGVWVQFDPGLFVAVNMSVMGDPSIFFLESCEWIGGRLRFGWRSPFTPMDFGFRRSAQGGNTRPWPGDDPGIDIDIQPDIQPVEVKVSTAKGRKTATVKTTRSTRSSSSSGGRKKNPLYNTGKPINPGDFDPHKPPAASKSKITKIPPWRPLRDKAHKKRDQ